MSPVVVLIQARLAVLTGGTNSIGVQAQRIADTTAELAVQQAEHAATVDEIAELERVLALLLAEAPEVEA